MSFDRTQPLLIVMIQRDLTHQCTSLQLDKSHPAILSVYVCGGNEKALPKVISESILPRNDFATA